MAKEKTSFMDILSPKKAVLAAAVPAPAQGTRTLRQPELPGTDLAAMAEKQTDMVERVLANSKSATPDQAIMDLKALSGVLEGLARKTVVVIFAIGKVLTEVKAVLPHGDFIPWVQGNCSFTQNSAINYMRIYDRYKDEPRRALEELTIAEAYIEAGVKKLMAPSEDEKLKVAGGDQVTTDGLPRIEDYRHVFKQPPASGVDLKRYRVITHSDGTIYAMNLETGMMPICNIFVNKAIENPDYKMAVSQVHKDVCLAAEAYYYRVEQLEDAGLLPKPSDLRMGSLMRNARNVTPEKPVKKVAKKPAKAAPKKGGKK
jgi:hypothetical protein